MFGTAMWGARPLDSLMLLCAMTTPTNITRWVKRIVRQERSELTHNKKFDIVETQDKVSTKAYTKS